MLIASSSFLRRIVLSYESQESVRGLGTSASKSVPGTAVRYSTIDPGDDGHSMKITVAHYATLEHGRNLPWRARLSCRH
jgi:hypothetical protein